MQKRDLKRELAVQQGLVARQAEVIQQKNADLRALPGYMARFCAELELLPELLAAVHEVAVDHDSAMLEDVQAAVKNGGMSVQAAVDAVAGECLSWDTLMIALGIDCSDSRIEALRDELHTRFTLVAQGPAA